MIKITPFDQMYGGEVSTPEMKAISLRDAGHEYFGVCLQLVDRDGPLGVFSLSRFSALLPVMHQAIELYIKSIATSNLTNFQPASKENRHSTKNMVDRYKDAIPAFMSIASTPAAMILLEQLEHAYLKVRYGQAHVSFDRETWATFGDLTGRLQTELAEASFTWNTRVFDRLPCAARLILNGRQSVRIEGEKAFIDGKGFSDNPYSDATGASWTNGWIDGVIAAKEYQADRSRIVTHQKR